MSDTTLSSGQRPDFWRDLHVKHAVTLLVIHVLGLVGLGYALVSLFDPTWLQVEAAGWTIEPSWFTIVFAYFYYRLCHYSISIGAHRLYAHTAFEAVPVLHYILVILFAGVAQGPIMWWSGVHRQHHTETDTVGDRHSRLLRGFLYSHVGWLMTKTGTSRPKKTYVHHFVKHKDGRYAPVWWQLRNYRWLSLLMSYGVPIAICSLWGDPLGGLLVGGFLRLVVQYHMTWAINSVTHADQPDAEGNTARDVPWLVYWAVGEGYHGKHHDDPRAWRFGKWDRSAFVLMGLEKLGLVTLPSLKTAY